LLLRLTFAAVAVYTAWLAVLFVAQERLIFPGAFRDAPPVDAPSFIRTERLRHPDGVETELWTMLPPGPPSPSLVYLHGTGRSIGHQVEAFETARGRLGAR
jgi:hypothetical protein